MIAERDAEIAKVTASGPDGVAVDGLIAREVLSFLHESTSASVERIARERGLTHEVTDAIVRAFITAGTVGFSFTRRGAMVVWFQASGPPTRPDVSGDHPPDHAAPSV